MFNSPVDILLFGVVILVAAFLGSWLAIRVNARRKAAPIPKIVETEVQSESAPSPPPARPAETTPIKHAFDFAEKQVTMILEMPVEMLSDDQALADGWVDVVSWARMAWMDVQEGKLTDVGQLDEDESSSLDESEITRDHLEGSLQRLHDAAERRRELRLKLAERQNGTPQLVAEE